MIDFSEDRESKLNNWLVERFGNEFFQMNKIKLSFEEASKQFEKFKSFYKDSKIKIITIAGTNGKGETAHTLNNLLLEEGYKVALWTSPHILSLRERICINGEEISYDSLEKCFERALSETSNLSYYEFLFYCFHTHIMNHQGHLDFLILEVGLGGRLDSVNYFDADLSGLTSISKDHCEILGDNLIDILKEKLGVTRSQKPLISNLSSSYLRKSLFEYCNKKNVLAFDLFQDGFSEDEDVYFNQNRLLALSLKERLLTDEFPRIENKDDLRKEASNLPLCLAKGRFERMTLGDKGFIFIGTHNIDGFKKLVGALLALREGSELSIPFEKVVLSFSKRSLDDVKNCLKVLVKTPCLSKQFLLSNFEHPKALGNEDIATAFEDVAHLENWSLVSDWKKLVNEANSRDNILVMGSYYFVGEVQKYLHSIS